MILVPRQSLFLKNNNMIIIINNFLHEYYFLVLHIFFYAFLSGFQKEIYAYHFQKTALTTAEEEALDTMKHDFKPILFYICKDLMKW